MNYGWCHDCRSQYAWADNNSSNCTRCSAELNELRLRDKKLQTFLGSLAKRRELAGIYEQLYQERLWKYSHAEEPMPQSLRDEMSEHWTAECKAHKDMCEAEQAEKAALEALETKP